MPDWLHTLALVSLGLALVCSLVIVADILRGYRQHMAIMNLVWPLTTLYSGPLGLWAYFRVGRLSSHKVMAAAKSRGEQPAAKRRPRWQSVGLATTHCGSGCTLGDIIAEGAIMPMLTLTLFGHAIFAAWAVDFVLAFVIGIAFQYFSIMPMKDLTPREGLLAALKADTASLTAWQIGMYGWMAIVVFGIFGHPLEAGDPVFWLMMQIAMLAGFVTSYPVNGWLVRRGIKEAM